MAGVLLKNGADPAIKDHDGWTAFDLVHLGKNIDAGIFIISFFYYFLSRFWCRISATSFIVWNIDS